MDYVPIRVGYIFMKNGKYVAWDTASGGYPYLTSNPLSVKVWVTVDEALEYYSSFPEGWVLYTLDYTVGTVELTDEDIKRVNP